MYIVLDGGCMIEKTSRLWNSIVKYIGCGLCLVAVSIAFNIQYLVMVELNYGDPLREVYLRILLIEFILLSTSVGVLNQQFSRRFWSLKKECGYLNMVAKGVLLVGFTASTLVSLSSPIYAFIQIPPPVIRFETQLWYMILYGLAISPIIGILAKEISFLGGSSRSRKMSRLLIEDDERGIVLNEWYLTNFIY
jgi:hypothetical protein